MKVVLYARVSTETQEEKQTVESQLSELRDYIKKKGYELVDQYIDDGWSGGTLARPELDRLRDDAKNSKFESILIHHPDRLARKQVYQGLVIEELERNGIKVIFLNRPNATSSDEDKLLLGVEGLFAEYERTKILERTRRGRLHKAKNGFIVTSHSPYGYDYIKKTVGKEGYLRVNKKEAEIVKLIFDLYTNKLLSVRGINKELLKRNILPRGNSRKWAQSTLHRILRNECYIGTAYYNKHYSVEPNEKQVKYSRVLKTNKKLRDRKEWIPITVPSIISKDKFIRAQELLKENSKRFNKPSKYPYLLSGLVVCSTCGSTYSGECSHNNLFYRCNNRHKEFPLPKECNQGMISASKLEDSVWQTISEKILNPKIIANHLEFLKENSKYKKSELSKNNKDYDEQILELKNKKEKIIDLYSEGIINKDDFISKKDKIDIEENRINEKISENIRNLDIISNKPLIKIGVAYFCRLARKRLESLNFDARKQFIRYLVDEIIFSGNQATIKGVIPIYTDSEKQEINVHSGIMSTTF